MAKEQSSIMAQRGLIKGFRIFLSGPIDRADDFGMGWRKTIRKLCRDAELGVFFFDPTNKPKSMRTESGIEAIMIQEMVREDKWGEAKAFTKVIRREDLRGVDWADIVIVNLDIDSRPCGTYDEVFTAYRESKPVYIIMAGDRTKYDIPSWLVSYIEGPEDIFDNLEDCVERLIQLDRGEFPFDARFVKIPDEDNFEE